YLKNPEVVRLLRDIGRKLKEELKTVFLISPLLAIPAELDKEVAVVEYPLPELLEIDAIFDRVSRNTGAKIPSGQEREHVVEAALGLTAEAEGDPDDRDSGRRKVAHRQGGGRGLAAPAPATRRRQDLRRDRGQLGREHAPRDPDG